MIKAEANPSPSRVAFDDITIALEWSLILDLVYYQSYPSGWIEAALRLVIGYH
jgi:hypothetical protein